MSPEQEKILCWNGIQLINLDLVLPLIKWIFVQVLFVIPAENVYILCYKYPTELLQEHIPLIRS